MSSPESNADGLAAFVEGLPQGQRHKGFYWAVKTAQEDGLPPAEMDKIVKAGILAGLDEAYIIGTVVQVQRN